MTKFVKQLFHMYILQWQAIIKNKSAIIIILALALLPSLYSWFNIAANEDPYKNVSNLKVAVVNLDKGTTIDVKEINVGENIVEKLKGNRQIGWDFVENKETALKGVKLGDYYAAIIIPSTFSKDLTSILHNKLKKPVLEYYVNEKINAIAPKVTKQGLTSLENEINQAFIKTSSEVILTGLRFLDKRYEEYKPELSTLSGYLTHASEELDQFSKRVDGLEKRANNLNGDLQAMQKHLPKINDTLSQASGTILKTQNALQDVKEDTYNLRKLIAREIQTIPYITTSASDSLEDLGNLKTANISTIEENIGYISDRLTHVAKVTGRLEKVVSSLNARLPYPTKGLEKLSNKLSRVNQQALYNLSSLDRLSLQLKKGDLTTDAIALAMQDGLAGLEEASNDLAAYFDQEGETALDSVLDLGIETLDNTYSVLQSSSGVIPKINDLLVASQNAISANSEMFGPLKDEIAYSKARFEKIDKALGNLKNDERLAQLVNLIRSDIDKQSDFLSHPIEVKSIKLYPIPNYGSAMMPFYTVLAIWVGSMLLMSMVSPINKKGLERYPRASVVNMYLSRLFFFQTVAVVQALIMTLGNLYILEVYAVHPIAMIFYNMWIGYLFSTIVFSFLFTFRSPGKAICIILLVLQVAASGGTFPVEMMPSFFQAIHPFLPFTYAIIGLRELSAGVEMARFISALEHLCILPFLSVLVVLIFGPKMIRLMERMEKNMKKSGIE